MAEAFETNSFVRRFMCSYQDNWTPVVGEQHICEWEEGNPQDHYAERPLRKVGIQ